MAPRRKAAEGEAPAAAEAPAGQTNGTPKETKDKPVYNVFVLNGDGSLVPRGKENGRNAKEALGAYFKARPKETPGDATWVLVPERMVTRVKAEVETKTRIALKSA